MIQSSGQLSTQFLLVVSLLRTNVYSNSKESKGCTTPCSSPLTKHIYQAEPFRGTITHHRMPPNTVVCRLVAWRLKTGAGSTSLHKMHAYKKCTPIRYTPIRCTPVRDARL